MNAFDYIIVCIKGVKTYFLGMLFVAAAWALIGNVQPYLTKCILDTVISSSTETITEQVGLLAIAWVFTAALSTIIFRLWEWVYLIKLVPKLKSNIYMHLSEKLTNQSHSFFQQNFSGSIVTKLSDIANGMIDVIPIITDRFIGSFLLLVFSLMNLSTINFRFPLALLVWTIFFFIVAYACSKKAQKLSGVAAESRSTLHGHLTDVLNNMLSVRFFATRKHENHYINKMLDENIQDEIQRDWFFLRIHGIQSISFLVLQAVSIWWLIDGYKKGFVSAGDFSLVISVNSYLVEVFWNMAKDFSDFYEKVGNISRGLETLNSPVLVDDRSSKELFVQNGKIEFDRVKFHYKEKFPIFHNKSVVIMPGEKVGLVGCSGSGKTTFVNMISRLFDVTCGAIKIDDQDIREVSQESLRKNISIINQDPSLFNRTLMENIRYGRLEATDEEVIEAAKLAHCHDFILRLPDGYQTMAGERGTKISGGQRQRIALARAILKNAPILILDEATSALDSVTEAQIQESLEYLMKGKTTIVIAHRLSTLKNMDRVLVFHHGKIEQDGSHHLLIQKPGLYRELWRSQVGGFIVDDLGDFFTSTKEPELVDHESTKEPELVDHE